MIYVLPFSAPPALQWQVSYPNSAVRTSIGSEVTQGRPADPTAA
jgi:hypothetical protein